MASYTRRTHIVRVKQPKSTVPDGQDQMYVDIEVLDAIAYQTTNGHVHVWKCPSSDADPYILDKTGDTPDWSKGGPRSTRGSHAKSILSDRKDPKSRQFDIEVLDRIAFRDDNGKIWCLDAPSEDAKPYCVTDKTGDDRSTRRTHLETIKASQMSGGTGGVSGSWKGPDDKDAPVAFVVERVDMVGFTGADEKKLVIKMESHDDDSGKRAETFCEPQGYDPKKKFGGVEVPESKDPNLYFKFLQKYTPPQPVFSASGFFFTLQILDGPLAGQTFFSTEFFPTAPEAAAAAEAEIAASPGSFSDPGVGFAPPTVIDHIPGFTSSPIPNTGGIKDNPDDTVKISMGPLWWVRAVYLGGGTAGDEHPDPGA